MSRPSSKPSFKPSSTSSVDTFRHVGIISAVARRRVWLEDVKAEIILETLRDGACVSDIARRQNISSGLLFKWRREARRQSHMPAPVFAEVKVAPAKAVRPEPASEARRSRWKPKG